MKRDETGKQRGQVTWRTVVNNDDSSHLWGEGFQHADKAAELWAVGNNHGQYGWEHERSLAINKKRRGIWLWCHGDQPRG